LVADPIKREQMRNCSH